MPDSNNNQPRRVLHVRPDRVVSSCPTVGGTSPAEMDAMLVAAELEVETCADVYRAMARVARRVQRGGDDDVAVFVYMDAMSMADTEFFAIASRLRPQPAVYVYGSDRADELVATAIGRGATGEATDELIASLSPELPVFSEDVMEVAWPRPQLAVSVGTTDPTDPEEEEPEPELAEEAFESDDELEVVEDEDVDAGLPSAEVSPVDDGAPRVPWRQYGDGPMRTPPSPPERRPPAPAPPTTQQTTDDDFDTGPGFESKPLLTTEELEALVGNPDADLQFGPDPDSGDATEDGTSKP